MIPTGTVKVGDRVVCPDGIGKIIQVYDQDNVMIELDRKRSDGKPVLAAVDLEKCALESDKAETAKVLKYA